MKSIKRVKGWKKQARDYFDKSLFLAVLLVLSAFLVAPGFDVEAFEMPVAEVIEVDMPVLERIEVPPEEITRPRVILLGDDFDDTDEIEIEEVDTSPETGTWLPYYAASTPKMEFKEFDTVEIEPELLRGEMPEYPEFGRKMGIEGKVVVRFLILKNGTVKESSIKIKETIGASFSKACIDVVKDWKFTPAVDGGIKVNKWYTNVFRFKLD